MAKWRVVLALAAEIVLASPLAAAEPVEFTLDNGLRIRLAPNEKDKRTAVVLAVRAGFAEEPPGAPHLAHVTEHLTVFDLKDKTLAQTAAAWFPKQKAFAETLGDCMYFDLYPEDGELGTALRIQAARLSAVDFDRETLLREVPLTLAEIEAQEKNDKGSTVKFALGPWVQAAWHGKTDVPMKANTKKITLDQVRDFHARTFRTDRAALLVAGPFDVEEAKKAIEAEFAKLKKPPKPPDPRPSLKPGSTQTTWDVSAKHLQMAWNIPAAEDAAHPALTLAGQILQQRLALDAELRPLVRLALVQTDVEKVFLVNLHLKADADSEQVQKRIGDALAELAKEGTLKENDLRFARLGLLTAVKAAGFQGEFQRLLRSMIWSDVAGYIKRLEETKLADVQTAIGKHLRARDASIVAVNPKVK